MPSHLAFGLAFYLLVALFYKSLTCEHIAAKFLENCDDRRRVFVPFRLIWFGCQDAEHCGIVGQSAYRGGIPRLSEKLDVVAALCRIQHAYRF